MSIARVTEISASSTDGFQDAIEKGIARANETLDNITSAWVQDQNVIIEKGKITEYRVMMKITFVLND